MITYDVNLCLGTDNPNKRLAVKCHDTGVNLRVYLQVCRPGKWKDTTSPYTIPAGSVAVLRITKPDKKYCITDGVIENNYALFEMNPQAFTAVGSCKAEVSLFGQGGRRITSGTFYIDVPEECICGCNLESENYIDVMSEQIRAAIDAADRAEAAVTHGPIINGGTWWLWNPETEEYEDSGVSASGGGITKETDPAVPAWAKQETKPTYTASEVGAIPAPAAAKVGQAIVVKAVDAAGKPTEWETADFPEGGGGGSDSGWRLWEDILLEEDVASIDISTNSRGEALNTSGLKIDLFYPGTLSVESSMRIWFNDSFSSEMWTITNMISKANKVVRTLVRYFDPVWKLPVCFITGQTKAPGFQQTFNHAEDVKVVNEIHFDFGNDGSVPLPTGMRICIFVKDEVTTE